MRSLLDALQEGRLIELPEVGKSEALEYLALLIEAIPDIGNRTDLVKAVKDRETQFNTGIGKGVAVPHCRTTDDGELLCAVGWSPKGIDYGAIDGQPVHLIVMYYVPDAQRNLYLKEISGLAKVVTASDGLATLTATANLTDIRAQLLDWLSQAVGEAVPDAKARMIKLEARVSADRTGLGAFVPLQAVCVGDQVVVLCADPTVGEALEREAGFRDGLRGTADFSVAGYHVARLSEQTFARGRTLVSAVAYRAAN